ncbi:MAG: hypothetical protein IKY11_01145, partial [Rikenellaceae bacterium]|nr:hypothetical protein [Rikenellaceae bacterium]
MMKKLLFILAVVILGVSCSSDSKEDNVVSYTVRIYEYAFDGTLPYRFENQGEFMDSVVKVLRNNEVHFGIYNVIAENHSKADELVTNYVQSQIEKFPTEELMSRFSADNFEFTCTYGAFRYESMTSNLEVYL